MAATQSIPILILAGQSNANNSDIIKASLDRAQAMGGMLVHLAVNGSPLSSLLDGGGGDWSAGGNPGQGELFRALLRQLDGLLNPASATYVPGAYLDGMIWLHGGADIFSAAAAQSYGSNLAALNAAMTARFGTHDLVISGMATASLTNRDLTEGQTRNWLAVQAAQTDLAASSPRIHLVDPDLVARTAGITDAQMFQSDYIHYSSTHGYAAGLGRALALAALPGTAANPDPSGFSYRAGTTRDDSLTLGASGMVQVWAGKGTDSVTLASRTIGVTVTDTGPTNARIVGQTGGPALFVDLNAVESLRLTAGTDDVHLGGGITSVSTLSGNDRVIGSAAAEQIWLGNGHDYAFGQGGDDRLFGGYGSDSLWGAGGNDALFGGSGNDRLGGDAGADTLTGGAGADVFVFNGPGFSGSGFSGSGDTDVITDFTNGVDKLQFEGAVWSDLRIIGTAQGSQIVTADIRVTVLNIRPTQIDPGDFIFG